MTSADSSSSGQLVTSPTGWRSGTAAIVAATRRACAALSRVAARSWKGCPFSP